MKRLTISLPDDIAEKLQLHANVKTDGRVSRVIRDILMEVLDIDDKIAQEAVEKVEQPPKVTIKEFEKSMCEHKAMKGLCRFGCN